MDLSISNNMSSSSNFQPNSSLPTTAKTSETHTTTSATINDTVTLSTGAASALPATSIASSNIETVVVIGEPFSDTYTGSYDGGAGYSYSGAPIGHAESYAQRMAQLGPRKANFFNKIYNVCVKIGLDLHVPDEYILGLTALESGWLGDHAESLHNPFGLTAAGGKDLSFSSYEEAANKFEETQGWRFQGGVTSVDQFISDLKKTPAYNSVNPDYETLLRKVIESADKAEKIYDPY